MPLKELLENIQTNLTLNIDSLYIKAITLIPKDIEHDLGIYKEKLKGQIETYLKLVVKNIIFQINHNFEWSKSLNEAIKD